MPHVSQLPAEHDATHVLRPPAEQGAPRVARSPAEQGAPHVRRPGAEQGATDRAVVALASRQHGRISAAQLAKLGLSGDMIAHRVASGWLVREHRGAYRLAGAPASGLGRCTAAVLAVDPESTVTHRSALERHCVLPEADDVPVHLTTARHHRSRRGIVVHQASLDAGEIVRLDGLRVTSLVRSLVDAAAIEPAEIVTAAVREAEFLRVLDPAALAELAAGRPGSALLRCLARERLPIDGELRARLERLFARFLLERRYPTAEVNRRVRLRDPAEEIRLDAVWWEAGLAVELDGRQAHATARAFDADRRRDRRVAVQLGLQVVRVTWRHLHEEPDALDADLKELYARGLAARSAA